MPSRYYFDFYDGAEIVPDDEGTRRNATARSYVAVVTNNKDASGALLRRVGKHGSMKPAECRMGEGTRHGIAAGLILEGSAGVESQVLHQPVRLAFSSDSASSRRRANS